MKSGVPWQVTGVRRQARDTAREAARRSGLSVGEWLDNAILDSALHDGVDPRVLSQPPYDENAARNAMAYRDEGWPTVRDDYVDDRLRQDRTPDDDRAPPLGYENRSNGRLDAADPAPYGHRNRTTARTEPRFSPAYDAGRYRPALDDERDNPAAARDRYRLVDDDDHGRPAPRDDRDRSADPWDRRQRADEARRRAAELVERLSVETAEDHRYRPAAEQSLDEVKNRLDSLTQQLSRLAEMNSAQASRMNRRDEEAPHQLVAVISKIDSRLNQLVEEGRAAKAEIEQRLNAQLSHPNRRDEEPPRQLLEAISRIDDRLDQLIAEGRAVKAEMEQRVNAVDRVVADFDRERPRAAVAGDPPTPLDQALSEIADRQRTLDGYAPAASGKNHAATPSDALPRPRTQELSGLEQQLRQINTQIETLRQPCALDKAVDTLRDDLAEIGAMLQEAMPRKAVEALESEVRRLADRVDHSRDAGADGTALTGVERGLGEVRDALHALTPAENLVGVDHAMRQLSQKIDLVTSNAQDPAALKQLESAIVTMRGIVSHVASNDALATLSDEVRALADKVEQVTSAPGGGVLSALEGRIAMLADALEARNQSGQNVPHQLEAVVNGLIDKIERVQLTRGDQAALGHLEDRIAKLVEKLDASDARLNHLEAIERGLADLLIHLEHQRMPNPAQAAAAPPPEMDLLSRDVADLQQSEKKTFDSLEVVHGTLGHVVDRLAMIETEMRSPAAWSADLVPTVHEDLPPPAAPPTRGPTAMPPAEAPVAAMVDAPKLAPMSPPVETALPVEPAPSIELVDAPQPIEFTPPPKPATPAPERRPIDPNLPPDHPLEPGSGVSRGRSPGSPADRIAASEAALAGAKPPVIPDPGGKANFIAAARRAAQAAGRQAPAKNDTVAPRQIVSAAGKLASRIGGVRTWIMATAAILLVLGSLQIARTLLGSADRSDADGANQAATSAPAPAAPGPAAAPNEPASPTPPAAPAAPPAGRQSTLFPAIDGTTITTPAPGVLVPADVARRDAPTARSAAPPTERDATGSVPPPGKPSTPAAVSAPQTALAPTSSPPASDKMPATFGSALRAAAARGDTAAQYEVALRYAEGRGVPQNLTEAAEWFERAAKQGLVPAQFRLGGFYEKGLGVKKDLEAARRFYLAAGEAGNAKALHNLAVLYAEGIDGKPDYPTAARWFRKAADYGVADSQYNLAILYGRGIGVDQNLTEAYRWFALAARDGDTEAAKKRDEVGGRLDPQSLKVAMQAVQAWTPEPQPEAAVQVRTPSGGWDSVGTSAGSPPVASAAAPAPAKRKPPAAGPKLDLSTPRPAQ
jgi:localization factor PodJL